MHGRLYNLSNTAEVVALIKSNELHPAYLPLQYPLLYPKGEDGYRPNILHKDHPNIHAAKRKKVTMREYFCYRLQSRNNEAQTILHSRRLFHQWIVDDYCMIESQKLNYVRKHQQQLRVDKYMNLNACNNAPETLGNQKGKRVILPSSFVGSQRYMEQLYFDGKAICGHIGFPNLFLTLTCNPTWSEIQRKVRKSNLTPHDCLDVVSQIFKMKLNQLMNDLKRGHVFGAILGFVYTIEWQKRGLSHAHILIFLHLANKYPNPEDIDKIISAEIPNKGTDPELTHLNVEWCNQSTSIKYLFKYINKGSDRITTAIVDDEIKHYLDCRYVSPPEACWKIFAFPMHGHAPTVKRLYFHLENQQPLYWTDSQQIGAVLSTSTIKESMFIAWMDFNKIYHHGRDLTYAEYVSKFVYVAHKRCWLPRKQGNTIERLIWVPLSSRELFYIRMMLSSAIGSQSYKDIKTVDNVFYHTFREAFFAKGFLGSDQEFVGALQEVNTWGTPHFLRKLFVKLLFMNTMDRPDYVWKQTWQWMVDDIVFNHRRQGYAANPHQNRLIYNETANDKEVLAAEFNRCYHSLTVASSGIVSLLLPGGRTSHSKFAIPFQCVTNLVLKHLTKASKTSCTTTNLLGGKVIVFGGDFWQILPVVPRGNRSDIVHASLNASYI
ncbi:hypothetical protein HKD37_20G056166 [Glycine soja]